MATRKEQLEVGIVATDNASKVLGDVASKVEKLDGETAEVSLTAEDEASDPVAELLESLERLGKDDTEVVLKAKADQAKREIDGIIKQIGKVDEKDHLDILIDAKNEAQAKLETVEGAIEVLNGLKAEVVINADDNATKTLEGVDEERKELDGLQAEVVINADDNATKTLEGVDEERKDLDGLDAEVVINADDNATSALEGVDEERKSLDGAKAEVVINADDNVTSALEEIDEARRDLDGLAAEIVLKADDQATTLLEEVDEARKDLDGLHAEVVVTGDVSNVQAGLGGVRSTINGIDAKLNGRDSSKSIFANFAGNAAQELPGVATAFGPLSMAVSQFVEYSAEGDINMRNMLKLAGPIAGMAVGFGILQGHMKEIAETKAFNKTQVDKYVEAIGAVGEGVEAVNLALGNTGAIVGTLPDEGIFSGLFGGTEQVDITNQLVGYGVSLRDISTLITDTEPQVQAFWEGASGEGFMATPKLLAFGEALQDAGVDADEVGVILDVLGQHQTNYDTAFSNSAAATELFAADIGTANTALDEFIAAQDPVAEMPATWQTLANAIEDGTIATDAGVTAYNDLQEAFPEMSDAEIFEVATGLLEDQKAAAEDAAEAQRDEYIASLEETAEAMQEVIDKQLEMAGAQEDTAETALALRAANRDLATATEKYNKILEENTDNQDDNNHTLIEEQEALDGIVESANDLAEAEVDAKRAVEESTGATMSSARALDIRNANLLDSANKATPAARQAILGYIQDLNGIPEETVAQISAALDRGDIEEANRLLNEASVTRQAYVKADVTQSSLNWTNTQLTNATKARNSPITAGVTSSSLGYVKTALNGVAAPRTAPFVPDVDDTAARAVDSVLDGIAARRLALITPQLGGEHHARGTNSARPGVALVGEEGPELVEFRGGEKVHTASQTRGMLGRGQAATQVVNYFTINVPTGTNPANTLNQIRRYERIQGPAV